MELEKIIGKEQVEKTTKSIKNRLSKPLRPFYNLKITENEREKFLDVNFSLFIKFWAFPLVVVGLFIFYLILIIGVGFTGMTYMELFKNLFEELRHIAHPVNEKGVYRKAE